MTAQLPRILLIEPQFVLRRTMVMVARDLGMVDFQEASSVGRARVLLATQAYEGMVLDLQEGPQALELLSDLNRTQGYTLAAVLHDLNQACRYATHLIALRDGKIVAEGAPKEIVTPELIERIYGMRCMIIDDPVVGTPLVIPLGKRAV